MRRQLLCMDCGRPLRLCAGQVVGTLTLICPGCDELWEVPLVDLSADQVRLFFPPEPQSEPLTSDRLPLSLGKKYCTDFDFHGDPEGIMFRVYQAPRSTTNPDHIEGKWYYDPLIGNEEQRLEHGGYGPYDSEGDAVVAAQQDQDIYQDDE